MSNIKVFTLNQLLLKKRTLKLRVALQQGLFYSCLVPKVGVEPT